MRTPRLVSWVRWVGAMSVWPLEVARSLLHRQATAWKRASSGPVALATASAWAGFAHAGTAASLAWPFDLARAQHAASVQAGLCERSLIASADFERRIDLLERMTLGPLARRV
jgi:hypothetical protein